MLGTPGDVLERQFLMPEEFFFLYLPPTVGESGVLWNSPGGGRYLFSDQGISEAVLRSTNNLPSYYQ